MKAIKFYAQWCQPCKTLTEVIKTAGDKITTPIVEMDIDEEMMTAVTYNVRSVPTMILLDENEKEIKRQVGMMTEQQLVEFLKG